MKKKTQDELIKELKDAVKNGDNEAVHSIYDDLIIMRLRQHEPSFVRMLDKITKDIAFWYA